ncbi:hypothetical protein BK669_01515 [Pseudomonas fluorescens]|nr:hypothetical protein BK669_01515 [Pseudomonas fluorescens]
MVGSPGKRAMLADMGEMGQRGAGEIIFGGRICVAWAGPIAGKPAPTGFSGAHECYERRGHCGSWLASDGPHPVDEDPALVYTCGELRQPQKVRTNKSAAIWTCLGENHRHA